MSYIERAPGITADELLDELGLRRGVVSDAVGRLVHLHYGEGTIFAPLKESGQDYALAANYGPDFVTWKVAINQGPDSIEAFVIGAPIIEELDGRETDTLHIATDSSKIQDTSTAVPLGAIEVVSIFPEGFSRLKRLNDDMTMVQPLTVTIYDPSGGELVEERMDAFTALELAEQFVQPATYRIVQ